VTITPPKTKKRKASLDPVRHYAEEVLNGGIVAGPYVRLAGERHLEDLQQGGKRGIRYDNDLAQVAFEFWGQLSLPEGGAFVLLPWQSFVIGSLLAWLGPDGYRRFRTAYIETGKGNGKSPLIGGIALYGLFVDDEPMPEIFAAATKKEQAKICFDDALNICKNSEILEGRYQDFKNAIYCPENGGSFKPISADKKKSGPRPHIALVDEWHEHETDTVVSMLRAGFKGRNQPLIVKITNTPQKETTPCGKDRDYSIKILNKVYTNDQWFAYVCSLDKEDDWKDEDVWEKANPSLGTIITKKYLRERVQEAEGIPDNESETKRLNFCFMTGKAKRSIDLVQWDRNNPSLLVTPEQRAAEYKAWSQTLRNRECFGGLDLGKVSDLTCYNLFFPPSEEFPRPAWLAWYWCPEEDIIARSKKGVPYDVWQRLGWLYATEGNTTDFDFVESEIIKLHGLYKIVRSAYDRTFAGEIVQHLIDQGCSMLDFGQGFVSMTTPTEYLLRYVKGGLLDHGSHPITRWCAENLVCARDPAGNIKPDKEKSAEKIDGISAGSMSIGAWLDKREKPQGPSVYEKKGQLLA
jgi:phage terminase large subunit-like protein